MPVSEIPWWWLADAVDGATCVWPIHRSRDPTLSPEIASRRVMPPVCAVCPDSAERVIW